MLHRSQFKTYFTAMLVTVTTLLLNDVTETSAQGVQIEDFDGCIGKPHVDFAETITCDGEKNLCAKVGAQMSSTSLTQLGSEAECFGYAKNAECSVSKCQLGYEFPQLSIMCVNRAWKFPIDSYANEPQTKCQKVSQWCPTPESHYPNCTGSLTSKLGDNIVLTPTAGFYVEGSATRECLDDKSWTFGEPSCKPLECDTDFSCKTATILNCQTLDCTSGKTCTLRCLDGSEYDDALECSGKDWTGEPTCEAPFECDTDFSCEAAAISNCQTLDCTSGKTCTLRCLDGSENDDALECSGKEWTGEPTCEAPETGGAPEELAEKSDDQEEPENLQGLKKKPPMDPNEPEPEVSPAVTWQFLSAVAAGSLVLALAVAGTGIWCVHRHRKGLSAPSNKTKPADLEGISVSQELMPVKTETGTAVAFPEMSTAQKK